MRIYTSSHVLSCRVMFTCVVLSCHTVRSCSCALVVTCLRLLSFACSQDLRGVVTLWCVLITVRFLSGPLGARCCVGISTVHTWTLCYGGSLSSRFQDVMLGHAAVASGSCSCLAPLLCWLPAIFRHPVAVRRLKQLHNLSFCSRL